ncbi:SEC14 protein 2-like [Tropilaelaps mercedesae]|uniref:SEC14 protein 2-like n=1 Tax=Tropilaelaps mercedesae TaxID=418985 RepID=A0A1V9XYK7_9ACAR|nr:SEC14 protein 2-like [Tropilaelaps mercedesae]
MSGHVGDLSEKQAAALDQFKRICSDLLTKDWHDDHYCLRWLRARNFNVEASRNMLENSMDFRHRYRLDYILDEFQPNEGIKAIFPGGTCGFDKQGGCVMLYPFSNIVPAYFLEMTRRTQIIKMVMYRIEESLPLLRAQSKKLGRNVESHTLILDVEGFDIMANISTAAISVFMEIVRAYESNYPETLSNAVVINAPPIFNIFLNMIKPLLNGSTLAKVKIYGKDLCRLELSHQLIVSIFVNKVIIPHFILLLPTLATDETQWKPALLEIIDPDQLPVKYGGTRMGPGNDPLCEHKIAYIRKLNQEVVHSLLKLIPEEDRMRQITVDRRSCNDVPIRVLEIDAGLHVEFESEGHDVAFGLLRRTSSGECEEILPTKRYHSHTGPVVLCIRCVIPGEYILHFDNTYSSLRSKHVSFNTRLIPAAKLNESMLFIHEP